MKTVFTEARSRAQKALADKDAIIEAYNAGQLNAKQIKAFEELRRRGKI
jgi:hypothetical protein